MVKPKLANKVLQQDDKFRDLVENISVGVIALDLDWHIIYLNKQGEAVLQRKFSKLRNKLIWDEFPGSVGKPFYNAYHSAVLTGQSMYIEEYSDALNCWIQASIYPSTKGVTVYFNDITKQKAAENRARQSEANYRQLLDRITDGFIALDKNFRYIYVNKKIGQLVNMDTESMIGKNVWDLFPKAVGSTTYTTFQTAMKEQRFISSVDYYAPLDLWQENYIYPSANGLSIFIKDISEKKRLELELKKQVNQQHRETLEAALEAQEKERSFIGRELHDNVNQVLTATQLTLEMVKNTPGDSTALIERCISNLKTAIYENRKLAHELVTPDLKMQTLVEQLTSLSDAMFGAGFVQMTIESKNFDEHLLNNTQKLALYRIAQEQFTNISKYAKAGNVTLRIFTGTNVITMIIADDGAGVVKESIVSGIGLRNIDSRLKIFGGSMQINTLPGKGFELTIRLPVENEGE